MFIMITFFLSVELIVLRKIFIVSVCTHPVENYVYLNFPFFFYCSFLQSNIAFKLTQTIYNTNHSKLSSH